MRTRLIGFLVLVVLGLILDQCSSAKRDDAGQITKSGDVSAFEIQVGDCFKELPMAQTTESTFSSVSAVPCNESHHWQSFYKDQLNIESFSEEAVQQSSDDICNAAAQNLINNMSAIKFDAFQNAKITFSYPTYKSWTLRGDRSVDCLIGSTEESYFTSALD